MKRNKIIICGIAATIVTIAAGITFYGCNKDSAYITKKDDTKILSYDPISGIDAIEVSQQAFFKDFEIVCNDFIVSIPEFSENEIAVLMDLLQQIQAALDANNLD